MDSSCRVIPKALVPHEVRTAFFSSFYFFLIHPNSQSVNLFLKISGESIGEVKIVSDMHQRKAEMAHQSDAFIALPGMYIAAHIPNLLCMFCQV